MRAVVYCGLHWCAEKEECQLTLRLGPRYIDSRSENGATALHIAAIAGELACVNVLLAAGASMMVRTVDLDMVTTYSVPAGSTPLHVAAQRGHVAILQAMLQVCTSQSPSLSIHVHLCLVSCLQHLGLCS